jgi:hypothetical protein
MGKAFGLILMLAALTIGMKIHSVGIERAYGGIFAPIASTQRDSALGSHLTPAAGMADVPMEAVRRGKTTDVVRDRVTDDLAAGMKRRGYE